MLLPPIKTIQVPSLKKHLLLACSVLTCLGANSSSPALSMPSIFGDHMVLQQDQILRFWGKGDPDSTITVRFREKSSTTIVDADGRWNAKMGPFSAGGPDELSVSSTSSDTLSFEDVLVGEVWLASGQSNMAMTMADHYPSEEINKAAYSGLRIFQMFTSMQAQPADDVAGKWIVCSPEEVAKISAVGYFFGRDLHLALKIPVGMIINSWGATPAHAWTPKEILRGHPMFNSLITQYESVNPPPPLEPTAPGVLYNAMIHPVAGFGMRGFVWFQGESDALAGNSKSYQTLLPLMIASWRSAWGREDIPFLIVQLANFMKFTKDQLGPDGIADASISAKLPPGDSTWAELREAQAMTARLPGNGMIVTTDIGDPEEIHFGNKMEVGRRLVQLALSQVYGQEIVYHGPKHEGVTQENGSLRVHFSTSGGKLQLTAGNELRGFAIAGKNKKFRWATAEIQEKDVILSHPDITEPVAVRYNWANNPTGNLANDSGLPAEPFRSDDWPGITK